MPTRAAIYARISSDIEDTGAGVARQVEDCHKLAASLGWQVAGQYVDNNISAYAGKHRPEYERMLADLADGLIDGVLVYHIDRLTRRPIELEQFLGVVDTAKVRHVRFVTGDTDLNTGDGLLVARMLAAVAANESAAKSRRVARKLEQNAAEGKPHKGSTRPFGYTSDFTTIQAEEAEILRQVVRRFLAGESVRSLASWLSEQEIPTVTRSAWQTSTVKGILINPRYAGLRVHRGQVVGPGLWDPIITEDEHRQVLAKFAERKTSGRRTPQRYLLSGMLRCGKCGVRLYSSARQTSRRYVCMAGPDHGGCGRLTITAEPLERFVADAVLYRLDTDELADTMAGRSGSDERASALTDALAEVTARLEETAAAYLSRAISMREWMIVRTPLTQEQETIQRQLMAITHTTALAGLVGQGEALGGSWQTLNLSRQHAIVGALIDHIVIGPGTPGVQTLDPARVDFVWRH